MKLSNGVSLIASFAEAMGKRAELNSASQPQAETLDLRAI